MSSSLPKFIQTYKTPDHSTLPNDIEWLISNDLVEYPDAVSFMETRVAAIHEGNARQAIWFLEHPPLYTAGTSAHEEDLLAPDRFPVYASGRGGQYTYHGPGQRVVYVMLDIKKYGSDVRKFVHALESWGIAALAKCDVAAEKREDRVGLWVQRDGIIPREDKVAAIGVRIRRWVSFHGMAFNVTPNLTHFTGIVPCGIAQHGVTSFKDLGKPATMADLDLAMTQAFATIFGPMADS